MSLGAGARLGPYEIVSALGAGGMGEVYRARDPRLGRDVAIKVLPAELSSDADRLSRFEQEARAAAALNHPNILAVHDIGRHDGAPYIVSELLEGETIRERLAGGAVPVRKATEYAIQIARGLAAAHDKAIVHRDLKPENIFVTTDGRVKILDFGLAKLVHNDRVLSPATDLPTTPPLDFAQGRPHTQAGLVLGTMGYMAPEQVRGLPADHHADIFAFGVVLYEMLSGTRAFQGQTAIDTLTAILKEDPADLPIAERHIPPALARVVDRCLEKNPAARFQTASDLGFALEALSTHSGQADITGTVPAVSSRRFVGRLAWAALGALVATTIGFALIVSPRNVADSNAAIRFTISSPPSVTFTNFVGAPTPIAVSPDGRRLIVSGFRERRSLLFVREMDAVDAQPLEGTEGANSNVFWSPDSRRVAFFQGGKLKTIDVSGGPAQTVCDIPAGAGSGAWSPDGTIVFSSGPSGELFKVAAAGGQPAALTKPDASRRETSHRFPRFLADGRRFLFVGFPTSTIWLGSLDGAEPTQILVADSQAEYSAGHLFFVRQGTLLAQPFDDRRGTPIGDPVPVAEQVQSFPAVGSALFSVSDGGVLAYRVGAPVPLTQLLWVDRRGNSLGTIGLPGYYRNPALSPEGSRLAIEVLDAAGRSADIWTVELARGIMSRFTFDPRSDTYPIWSPDGKWIMFASDREGNGGWNLYQKLASGAGGDELVRKSTVDDRPYSWSPDGRYLVYRTLPGGSVLNVLPLFGDRQPLSLPPGAFGNTLGQVSPDSRWMAYSSVESGRFEVYARNFPMPGGKWQISKDGAVAPRWRGDGKELFYYAADGQLMAVPIKAAEAAIDFGTAVPLFSPRLLNGPTSPNGFRAQYDVARDGQRFLLNVPAEQEAGPPSITVVVNWTAGLKQN